MAMDWLKWVKGLTKRREVLAVAVALSLDVRIVASACMEMWEWADDNTTTGFVPGLTTNDIDRLLSLEGFGNALSVKEVGWLDVREGGIQFPRWNRHNSRSAKRRALAALRQRRKRAKDVTPPSRSPSRNARNNRATREEKNREEKRRLGLDSLSLEELCENQTLLARWAGFVRSGGCLDTEVNRQRFFAAAEHAIDVGHRSQKDPCGLFRSIVEGKSTDRISDAADERARQRLRAIDGDGALARQDEGYTP